jgi:hypothetical protein
MAANVPKCAKRPECDFIRFEILMPDCPNKQALAQVAARPCNCPRVPEETPDEKVTVHDPLGCFLVEPNEDLVGRGGFAKYLQPVGSSECQWEIHSLCCPEE